MKIAGQNFRAGVATDSVLTYGRGIDLSWTFFGVFLNGNMY